MSDPRKSARRFKSLDYDHLNVDVDEVCRGISRGLGPTVRRANEAFRQLGGSEVVREAIRRAKSVRTPSALRRLLHDPEGGEG